VQRYFWMRLAAPAAKQVLHKRSNSDIFTKISSIRVRKKMANTTTLSSKFQISIPKAVRTSHQWAAGQAFAFIPKGTGVLLVPVPSPAEMRGIAAGANPNDYRDRSDRF
jgi:AbrB family looped-hinge helix DNA binding protein